MFFYGTFSATLTILHVPGNLDLAIVVLQTVRHEKEEPSWRHVEVLSQNQLIVYGNKGMADLLSGKTKDLADHNKQRKEYLNNRTAEFLGEEEVTTS